MNWYTSASFTVLEIYVDDTFLQICCCALQCLSFMACHVEITIFKIVRVVWRSASSITTSTTSSNTFKLNIKNVVLTLQRRKWEQLFSNILEVFAISYNLHSSYFCTVIVGELNVSPTFALYPIFKICNRISEYKRVLHCLY